MSEIISPEEFYQSLDLASPEVLIESTLPQKLSHDVFKFVYEVRRLVTPGGSLYKSIMRDEQDYLAEYWQDVMEYSSEKTAKITPMVQPVLKAILRRANSYYHESKHWEDTEPDFRLRFA